MWYEFRWIDWNVSHIGEHGLTTEEVEFVVNNALLPFPTERAGGDSYRVAGPTPAGLWIHVLYSIGDDDRVFVFHARPLTVNEARNAQKAIRKRSRKS